MAARKRRHHVESGGERFAALDLIRGVAALAVLSWHAPKAGVAPPLGRAYLAVDLFFVLSGFVIAHAYEQRLRSDGGFRQFCAARLIRLYPLYLAATLLSGAFILLVALAGTGRHASVAQLGWTFVPAFLFLPTPASWSIGPKYLYPLAVTAWSLLWELLVNLLYGAIGFRIRGIVFAVPMVAGAAGIVAALSLYGGLDLGWGWEGAWCGAPRALFSFFAGVAIFRIRKRFRAPRTSSLLVAAVLIGALVPADFAGRAYDAGCVMLLFPLLVWLGAEAVQGDRVRSAGALLGYLSYPVYLLQGPIGLGVDAVAPRLSNIVPQVQTIEPLAYVAVTITGSWLIARLFDSPVRDSLRQRFLTGIPRPSAQTAP